jgi:hypothetical protein
MIAMKVDPNQAVDMHHEMVLCEAGRVELADGSLVRQTELSTPDNPFAAFCKSLDPNKCFILALVPDDADKEVYFQARSAANALGIQMHAPLEEPERCRKMWESYLVVKRLATGAPKSGAAGENR